MYHYVYRITEIISNMHYYGIRSSKVHPIEDLGVKYFSSSTDREFKKNQKEHPENYRYKIVRICEAREQALELEIKLHKKFNVDTNNSFYNKAKQNNKGFDSSGFVCCKCLITGEIKRAAKEEFYNNDDLVGVAKDNILTDETKMKMSEAGKNKIVSTKTREKLRKASTGRGMSIEARGKISKANKGLKRTEEQRRKNSESLKGIKRSNEFKESRSGLNNLNGLLIHIFDSTGNLMFVSEGCFHETCNKNNLPHDALKTTYQNNTYAYNSNRGKWLAISIGRGEFIGWYARIIK